jgi:hypothetical protein
VKLTIGVVVVAIVLGLQAEAALAGPKEGVGLYAGLAHHTMTPPAGFLSSSSSGLSVGIDYQVVMSDKWSLNPFLMSAGESSSENGVTVGHGILGLQTRYWSGDMFFGGHIGNYSEVRMVSNTTSAARGFGGGLLVGWEDPNGKLSVTGQIDRATVKYSNADVAISGFRLNMGYRWK